MKKINNLLMMALLTIGMGLTSCDEQLDNAVTPYTPGVTPESEVAVTSITFDKTVLRIDKYNTIETLKATVSPAEATDKTVTWKSSDETVATVDANGQVTPIKAGTVTIEATAGDKTATSTVYVYDEIYAISDIDITKNALAGKSYLFTSNGTPLDTKINIEDGATVTLKGINITNQIACDGNATIILADGSENTVTVSTSGKAGIQIGGTGTTLTINAETAGTGTLTAKGGSDGAGIGTSMNETGGNIVINGGTVTATGGSDAAGIGTGDAYGSTSTNKCDAITINGGTVIATGGKYGAGIGTGNADYKTNECGDITIKANVTSVTATKGTDSPNSIGKGKTGGGTQKCGTITFGTAAVFDGSAWSPATMVAGTYGDLKLVISKKNDDDDTWTLTPAE